MCPAILVNRHRGLAPDELTRRYRRTRDAVSEDDLYYGEECFYWDDYDDYWDPQRGRTADDYLVLGALEESIGFAFKRPKLGELLPAPPARIAPIEPAPEPRGARPSHAPDELAEALFAHLQDVLSRARAHQFALGEEIVRINGGRDGLAEALQHFEARPGPLIMSLVFAPFWVRPLASWRAPQGDDAAITRSLIEHLFQVYPVPRALQQPWLDQGLPSLKWVLWLILLGQGGNLHRAARRFGWSIAKRFTHHFMSAPEDLTALEACMWAEITRAGGDRVDLDRIRRNPAYAVDPTDAPRDVLERSDEDDDEDEDYDEEEPIWVEAERGRKTTELAHTRAFWHETVAWLIRSRDQLTDASSNVILEWGMHLYTESVRRWVGPYFSWRGREPASAHAAALEYRRLREMPYGDLRWKARGFDWESGEGEPVAWTVRELTSSSALAEESREMHHCVASYAHRCALGSTAIFSLCADGVRKITIELDPFSHRVVQARGACNRAATAVEQAVIDRWLAAKVPEKR